MHPTFLRHLRPTLAAAALVAALPLAAQDFPSRPVKVVVASVPGSAPDVLARVLAESLGPALRQSVVVENKPGAGGVIGVDSVAKAAPDGHTLVIGHDGTMAMSFVVQPRMPYDPQRDFAPVASLGFNEFVLVVHAGVPARNFQEFLAYARSQPGKVRYGSAGAATPNHVIMEQLARASGFSAVHVPYKGGPAAVQDLVGGQIEAMVSGISPALPHIRSGRLVAIAVPQAVRSPVLPDVPTMAETLPGFAVKSWFGLFAPAQTPPAVIATLNREVRAALDTPAVRQRIAQQGMAVEVGTSAALAAQVTEDIARYRVLATQIRLDGQ
jgi:tripartite-type tricarboxylate transporter receptor subunit TctC